MKEILENKELKRFPFEVADSYFASIEERVKVRLEGEGEDKKVGVFRTFKATLALAASFLLILLIGGVIVKYSTKFFDDKKTYVVAQDIDIDELIDRSNSVYMEGELLKAYLENDSVDFTIDSNLDITSDSIDNQEGFEDVVTDYLDQLPSSFSHLIAEHFR